jgi:4-carboxymuconolactone decarboxylase
MTEIERRALVGLSAALASRDSRVLAASMETCLREADPCRVEEVILQSYLFLGYPAALNAFGLWRGISSREVEEAVPETWEDWSDRGREVCRIVYAGQYQDLRRNIRALHPDMERWMVVEGYGKVLGRPELDLVTRELCIASLLAVLGAPRQLHSHLRGALNAGATVEEVEEAVELAGSFLSEGDSSVRAVWSRVRSRWVEASSGSEAVHRPEVPAET